MTTDFQRKSLDNIISSGEPEKTEQPVEQQAATSEGVETAETEEASAVADDVADSDDQKREKGLRSALQRTRLTTRELKDTWDKREQQYIRQQDELNRQLVEALSRNTQQPQQQQPEPANMFEDPDRWKQETRQEILTPIEERLQKSENRMLKAEMRASRAELITEHGKEAIQELDLAVKKAMEERHPDLPMLRQAMIDSGDPAGTAWAWYQGLPEVRQKREETAFMAKLQAQGWQPPAGNEQQGGGEQQIRQGAASQFPSNLAGARNVGTRAGPAWSGPTPLADIFKR